MDNEVVAAKIETLRRCIRRIEEKTPRSADSLANDFDLQDIICINLERAIQVCVDLASHLIAESNLPAPVTMAESFDHLRQLELISDELAVRMKKAVGFRNIAVQPYQKMNWDIVYNIIARHLGDFSAFAQSVARAAGLSQGSN